jgi:hypothetical protein
VLNPTLVIQGLDEMQAALEQLSKKGLAAAARETLTNCAWEGRRIWQGNLEQSSILRNKFTQSRVLVDPARGSSLVGMEARLGHPSQYVADLEEGKGDTARGSAVPIPELAARTGGDKRKLVGRPNKLATIGRLSKGKGRGGTHQQRNAGALRMAAKQGKKFVVLEGTRSRGIFRVLGGRKHAKVRKLWDLSHRTVTRPKRPTLQRTLDATLQLAPAIAERAMQKQLALLGPKRAWVEGPG